MVLIILVCGAMVVTTLWHGCLVTLPVTLSPRGCVVARRNQPLSSPVASLHLAAQAARTETRAATVPWYLWMATLAVTCAMTGVHWDIS